MTNNTKQHMLIKYMEPTLVACCLLAIGAYSLYSIDRNSIIFFTNFPIISILFASSIYVIISYIICSRLRLNNRYYLIISIITPLVVVEFGATTAFAINFSIPYFIGSTLLLFGRPDQPENSVEHALVSLLIGFSLFGPIMTLTTMMGVTNGPTIMSILVISLLARLSLKHSAPHQRTVRTTDTLPRRRWQVASIVTGTALSLFYLLSATGPEASADGLAAYYSIFEIISETGGFHFDPARVVWGSYPVHGILSQAPSYLVGGETGLRLMNAGGLLAGAAMIGYACYTHTGKLVPGAIATVFALSLPITLRTSVEFYVENWVTFYLAGAFLVTALYYKKRITITHYTMLLCLSLSAAAATKHTSLLAIPFFLAPWSLAIMQKRKDVKWTYTLIGVVTCLLLVAAPMYITSYIKTGNPVFPYFNQIFESAYFPLRQHNSPHPGYAGADFLWQAIANTSSYSGNARDGAVGFGLLVLVVAAVASTIRHRNFAYAWPAVLAYLNIWLLSSIQNDVRLLSSGIYLFAASLIILVFASPRSQNVRSIRPMLTLLSGCLLGCTLVLNVSFWPSAIFGSRWLNFEMLFSREVRAEIERSVNTSYLHNTSIPRNLNGETRVVYLATHPGRTSSDGLTSSWHTPGFSQRLEAISSPNDVEHLLSAVGAEYVIVGTHPRQRAAIQQPVWDFLERGATLLHQLSDGALVYQLPSSVGFSNELTAPSAEGITIDTGEWHLEIARLPADATEALVHYAAVCEPGARIDVAILAVDDHGQRTGRTRNSYTCSLTGTFRAEIHVGALINFSEIDARIRINGEEESSTIFRPQIRVRREVPFRQLHDRSISLEQLSSEY